MAITIQTSFEVTGAQAVTQATAQATSAFKGLQDQIAQTERATTSASTSLTGLVDGLLFVTRNLTVTSAAFRESVGSIQAAIKANTAYAQSLASISAAAASAQKVVSASILGGRALGGAGAESVASLQAAAKAGVSYQQSLVSINEAATQYARTQRTVQQQTQQTSQIISGLSSSVQSLAAGFGVILGAQGFVSFVRSLVEAGLQMERFERTLTAAVGSTRGALEAFKFITAESNRLGQSVTAMIPIFVQLTAATRNTVLEGERTRELFSAMAGAGQAVGLSTDAVAGAMLGLTQIISQNAIQLDEFRNQFASRIPGAMLETAKALKTLGVTQTGTIAEMLKGFERGRISVADLTKAVTMGLKEIQRTAPEMGNSAAAAFTQLSNAAFQLKADLARSGLLEFLTDMAQTARSLIAQVRQAMGLGGTDFLRQVGELQGKLADLRKERETLLKQPAEAIIKEPPKGVLDAILNFESQVGITQEKRLERVNQEIALQEERLRKIQEVQKADKDAESEKARLSQERRDKEASDLKASDAAAAAARQGAQDAAARARAGVSLTQERVNQEKVALEQTQALREQALERDYATAVANTQQTKSAQEDIERAFAIRRLDISRQTALEDAALQERTAIQIRDSRIAAIKAADAAAQAASAAPGATAEAQINANNRSAASAIELQTVTLAAETAKQEAAAKRTAAAADYEKAVSAVVKGERTSQIKITEQQLQREAELRQQALQSHATILSAETELVQAQVEGLVLTKEEGLARTQALEVQALDNRQAQLEAAFTEELRILEKRVAANEATEQDILDIRARHAGDVQALNIEQQTLEQSHRNELLQGWIDWVRDVESAIGNTLFQIFDGQISSIKDLFDDLKSYFFRTIANMIAYAATNAIVIPVVSSLLGGFGGGAGGVAATAAAALGGGPGLGGGAGGAGAGMDILGVAGIGLQLRNLLGPQGVLGTATNFLSQSFFTAGNSIANLFGRQLVPQGWQGPIEGGPAALGPGLQAMPINPLMALGGLAGIGGGIYSAVTAKNVGGMAGGAIGAAGGAIALASALGLVLTPVLGPIGLALAALAPLLGSFLGGLGAPAGPRFALGGLGGVGIGADGGRLDVRGRVTSQVGRQARLPEGTNVGAIQEALQARVQTLVEGMVTAINAVALQPESLLGQTQDALNHALRDAIRINSSSAKNFQKDMEEQIKFAGTQVGSFFLKPLNEAFRQLESADLEQQIARLPETTTGMVSVFKGMNDQLDELSKVANTDVLRQLSSVRNRVEDFGNALADTARVIATDIVSGTVMRLESQVKTLLDQPLAKQISGFGALMNQSFGALEALRTTQKSVAGAGLETGGITGQIDILTTAMVKTAADVSTQIVNGALGQLSSELSQVTAQAVSVQATTVNSLFNDSLAALQALWDTWHRLEETGLDAGPIQAQFTKLLGGILDTTTMVLDQALAEGSFAEFLGVLASIPKAVTDLNPAFAKLQALGAIFGQVVGPIAQNIATLEDAMRTTAERADVSATRIADLRSAIADAGDSADQSLPLYAQLSTAIMANAELQIQVIRAMQQAWQAALDQVQSDIDTLEAALGSLEGQVSRALTKMSTSAQDFNTALAEGDILGAIENIHAYEQDLMALTALQIQQIEAQRQATIDAQQEVIDGVQDQVDVQQKVIDGVQDQMDAQQKVIDATQKQIDGQQKVIDATQKQIDAQQKVIDSVQDLIDAQQEVIAGIQDQINAVEEAARAQQEYINLLQDEVNVRQQAVDSLTREIESLTQLRERVGGLTRAELAPAQAAPAIREQIAATQAQLATVGGEAAITALEKLISLNQELLQLGEESSQLTLIQEALNNLNVLQADLNARLSERTAELGVAEQHLQVAQAAVDMATLQLDALNAQIAAMDAQLKAQQDVLKGIEAQLKFQQAQLEVLHTQLAFDQANLEVLHTQLAFDQAQLKVLADQLAVEQGELKSLNDQLNVQQEALRKIQESTYWDQQIAQVQTIALYELYKIRDWLATIQGDTSWEDQVLAIQRESLSWLRAMEHDLQALFIKTAESVGAAGLSLDLQRAMVFWQEKLSLYNLALPVPMRVTNFYEAPRQRGGLVGLPSGLHYAQGGLVPTLLEPGESHWTGYTAQQGRALMAVNEAFPRFAHGGIVPGTGDGDRVPMFLPSSTIIVNRNGTNALRGQGFQGGGMVNSGSRSPQPNPVTINVDLRGSHFSTQQDLEKLKAMLLELQRRGLKR